MSNNPSPFANAENRFGKDLVEILSSESVIIDLKYNGIDNFMGQDLYHGFSRAFLHQVAFAKFAKAQELLAKTHPALKFLVLDCLRPRSVQRRMRAFVADTPMKDYVADPDLGSMHNFGMAIDLTLIGADRALDMGTEFDDFTDLAQPQLEPWLAAVGKLTRKQLEHRKILRDCMTMAGFIQLPHEWWHYNALPAEQVRGHYLIVE